MSFISVPPRSSAPALAPLYELESPPPPPRRHQLHNALYRGRWLVLGLALAGVLVAAAGTWMVRPYYQAEGSIIISHLNLHDAEITPQEYPPPVDADRELQTELTILDSRAVATDVISELQLQAQDPEISRAEHAAAAGAAKKGEPLSAATRADIADGVFAGKLKAVPDKVSATVHIDYGSHDPQLAARVVNATIAAFMAHTLQAREQQGDDAAHWMQQQVAAATTTLAGDDQAVADFQRQHAYTPLLEGNGAQSGLLDRLSDANHAWSTAVAQRIADEAAVRSYAGGAGGANAVVAALPAELRDPAIDRASENVGAAQQQLTTLETTYRPDFPLVIEARAQLAGAQRKLQALRTQVSAGLEQRLASSQRREAELEALVGGLNQQAAAASGLEMQFAVLKNRADAQRNLVDTLRQKLAEVEMEATLPPANLQLLDAAVAPLSPQYPQLPLDLGLGLAVGLALGLGTALAREHWSEALTGSDAVKRGLGPALAPLGMIAEQARPRRGARALLPAAVGAEDGPGYAKVAANLVARCGPPPRAVLITSANPGEGKTTTLCRLGLALAQAGWRTLLLDADSRRPGCHTFFGLPNAQGLMAAQAGRKVAPLPAAPHLDLMPCESEAAVPLQTRAVAALLEQWREHYDYILIDSPPGNLTGEAVLLSSLVEGVLVVLRWGRTRLPEAQQLCEELARAQAPLLGTLFNRADPGAPAFRTYRPAATALH